MLSELVELLRNPRRDGMNLAAGSLTGRSEFLRTGTQLERS